MKVQFVNLDKLLIGILLGVFVSLFLLIKEIILINKLEEIGVESVVISEFEYSGESDNGFYNYYFITKKNQKLRLTHNINTKMLSAEEKHYANKRLKYNPLNPNEYKLLGANGEMFVFNIYYYIITLPLITAVLYFVLLPSVAHKRLMKCCWVSKHSSKQMLKQTE